MMNIEEILYKRSEALARLKVLPYTGTPELKEIQGKQYLYVRNRVAGRLQSEYVGVYDEVLYAQLLNYAKEARALRKQVRQLEKSLADLEYSSDELSSELIRNLQFARANIKHSIYAQAVLEGVATTFPQTECIIDNGKITGMTATDVQKVLNLKHAWEFILDEDVIRCPSDYGVLCRIAKLVNEGFFREGDRLRDVPVRIGGTNYIPPLPREEQIKQELLAILQSSQDPVFVAIQLCLWCMKSQLFNDGNKRTGVIFANHYLIAHNAGLLIVPEHLVPEFKKRLVQYYEGYEQEKIVQFLREYCWQGYCEDGYLGGLI